VRRFRNLARTVEASAVVLFLAMTLSAAHQPHAVQSHKPHEAESRKPHEVESRKPHEALSRKAHPVASHPEGKKLQNKKSRKPTTAGINSQLSQR